MKQQNAQQIANFSKIQQPDKILAPQLKGIIRLRKVCQFEEPVKKSPIIIQKQPISYKSVVQKYLPTQISKNKVQAKVSEIVGNNKQKIEKINKQNIQFSYPSYQFARIFIKFVY